VKGPPLVTGASGFAGSHLVERLLQSHSRVAAWAHNAVPEITRDTRVEWEPVDVLDAAAVRERIQALQPGVIYHCAGLPHVAESWRQADRALRVNAVGTHHLLEAVREVSPDTRTVVVGSAMVYKPALRALREDDPVGPTDPYGISKLAQEMLGLRAATPVVVVRPFNHIGPRQAPAFVTSSFAKQVAEIEAGLAAPTLKVGNLDAARDMTDVRDTVRAYEALAADGTPGAVYNVCCGTAYRVGDLLDMLLALARVPISIEQDPTRLRPSDNPLVLGDTARIHDATGWRPRIPIQQSLQDLLDWWRARIPAGRP
jgi:GDP-4-dehydro-6-deoxy-D-mannose reductase